VNIALIERGKQIIATPGRDERLYPFDKITVIGSDDQLAVLKEVIETVGFYNEEIQHSKKSMELQKLTLTKNSPVCGLGIRDSGIREKTQGLIVGIERNGERILTPDSSTVLKDGDLVWIVGNKKKILEL